jgi:hypothetical protein
VFGRWMQWNRRAKAVLWFIALLGVAAAMPLGATRMEMEKTSKHIEYVFDYRDIIEVAEQQPKPKEFLAEQLIKMKTAGFTTMAVYESTLKELAQAGRLTYYSSKEAALLQGKLEQPGQNFTYILFTGTEEAEKVGAIVRSALDREEISYRNWSFDGREGLIAERSTTETTIITMDFDPMSLENIKAAGFGILPRLSDRIQPFDAEAVDAELAGLKELGAKRVLFNGDKVKGASQPADLKAFGELLDKHGIGIASIENLKKPQKGINNLAYLTNYNIVRLYSLSEADGLEMTAGGITDRFLLAAKDRNIRMFFVNGASKVDGDKVKLVHSLDKLAETMQGEKGVVQTLADAGFPSGDAEPLKFEHHSWSKPLRGVVALGAVALIALLVGAFIPGVNIPVFLLGVAGSAGLYVLNSSLMEQALALGAGIAAPTLGLVWVMNRIYSRTIGERRIVGGSDWNVGRSQSSLAAEESKAEPQTVWVFPPLPAGKRIGSALIWLLGATLISLTAVPIVFGLLSNITYSYVLEQFRGVSVLHLAPIALVAIYVLLYNSPLTTRRIRAILHQPITVLMIVAAAVIGVVGFYYLSRTGNSGQVSSLELVIRRFLESATGVRPRFKEFLLAHPLLLLGLFLSLRYRAAWLLVIVGSIGQLSMVDTFAHLHTPLYISMIRVALGLGTGIIIGCLLIVAWQIAEGVVRKWAPAVKRKLAGS